MPGSQNRRSDDDGLSAFHVEVPGRDRVELTTDGEVFTLRFRGGYRWAELADPADLDDAREALDDVLELINAYGDSATAEAIATRRWHRPGADALVNLAWFTTDEVSLEQAAAPTTMIGIDETRARSVRWFR